MGVSIEKLTLDIEHRIGEARARINAIVCCKKSSRVKERVYATCALRFRGCGRADNES